MPCLQKNGAVTPQYRQRLCPPGQGHFFHAVLAHSGRAPVSKTTGRWFESTRMKTKTFCKQKTASVSLRWRAFYGRGWITQAAHLKKPRRGFFPRRTVRRVDAVRIHPPSPENFLQNRNSSTRFGYWSSWWARVDSNHRS